MANQSIKDERIDILIQALYDNWESYEWEYKESASDSQRASLKFNSGKIELSKLRLFGSIVLTIFNDKGDAIIENMYKGHEPNYDKISQLHNNLVMRYNETYKKMLQDIIDEIKAL